MFVAAMAINHAVFYNRYMFSQEVRQLLAEVISSWQVIMVTIVIIIYIFIVNRVSKVYRRSRSGPRKPILRRRKKEDAADVTPAPSDNDELGLEDEV